jgi:hypothetical protein
MIIFVKDEGSNLGSMAIKLWSIIDCELILNLLWIYEGTCFGHVMFKTCQNATNDDKDFYGFNFGECERSSN